MEIGVEDQYGNCSEMEMDKNGLRELKEIERSFGVFYVTMKIYIIWGFGYQPLWGDLESLVWCLGAPIRTPNGEKGVGVIPNSQIHEI